MRWTRTFIQTLREAPQEAEIRSHRLMIRAGLIQKLSSGLYTFLPLGLRSLRKVEKIVREVLNEHGALELLLPILQPEDIWRQSGRWEIMRDLMLVAEDRQQRSFVLGPTHEEVITDLVSKRVKSYRDLPKNFYQIQTKFRDEIRPRFGLMRAREFLMKDGYSFDVDDAAAEKSYWNMAEAYQEIFKRCGMKFKMVEADTGVMGGSLSHEFMVLADSGEDEILVCPKCDYSSNRELTKRFCLPQTRKNTAGYEKVPTPHMKSVQEVSRFLGVDANQLIKTMIYKCGDETAAVLCRGDVQINESKLSRFFGGQKVLLADEKTVENVTGSPMGFSGPVGLQKIKIYADLSVEGLEDAVAGANELDAHLIHVNLSRDAKIESYEDIGFAQKGDLCGKCRAPLESCRGIEVGHVFKLGTKYSKALGAVYLNQEGVQMPCVMGCYGIGVSRTLAAFVEQSSTEDGIVWSRAIAPYEILIVPVLKSDSLATETAFKLYEDLKSKGYDVLIDDRDERPGVKFKDADLIGFPIQITLGQKYLSEGKVEVLTRSQKKTELISLDALPEALESLL